MIPLVETAASTPFAPNGLKPSAAWKLLAWKLTMPSTKIVSSGTPTFHQVAALFVLASLRMPRKLIEVKIAIRTTAATMPGPVSTLVPPLVVFIQPLANE